MFEHRLLTVSEAANAPTLRVPGGENYPLDNPNFTDTVSTIMVEAIVAPNQTVVVVLDGDIRILCHGVISKGDSGIEELKALAKTLFFTMGQAVASPDCPPKHREYYAATVKDASENGLNMPMYGKITF